MLHTRLVVGTAGHIDHGKSSLVKALTGVDPDRLKEEKARGITIELGFAPLDLPGGQRLAFVDVPGHERFIRQMVAGATGIDLVLLVIAADEGVMEQTREHLEILTLLGVSHGAIVLTKVDLVDEELLLLALEDAAGLVRGTFLEQAPVLPCSSVTGAGLDSLRETLARLAEVTPARSIEGPFRLPIDRVFTLRGFGTIVTGTVLSGQTGLGEPLELLPTGQKVKVRGMQVHGQEVSRALAGQRAALNLQGLDRDAVARGFQLVSPGQLIASAMLDVSYLHLETLDFPLEHRMRVRFLSGTYEVTGVAHILGTRLEAREDLETDPASADASQSVGPPVKLEAGARGFLQLRLDAPVATRSGDRFILRLESPLRTLGGGEVIDPAPHKHRRQGRTNAAQELQLLAGESLESAIGVWVERAGPTGISLDSLSRRSGHPLERVREAAQAAAARGELTPLDSPMTEIVSSARFEACKAALLEHLSAFHLAHPLRPGASRGDLRRGLAYAGERVVLAALAELVEHGEMVLENTLYRLADFQVHLSEPDQCLADALARTLQAAGVAPPLTAELAELHPRALEGRPPELLEELLQHLTQQGLLTRVRDGHYVWSAALEDLRLRVTEHLQARGELTPADFKALSGLSRKWAIPMLEYFDRIRLTLRVGDVRRLRREDPERSSGTG